MLSTADVVLQLTAHSQLLLLVIDDRFFDSV